MGADTAERDPFLGRVRRYTRIECAACGTQDEHSMRRPVEHFVRLGWRKRGGLWRCPRCEKEGPTDDR